jgi:hypothetical protein
LSAAAHGTIIWMPSPTVPKGSLMATDKRGFSELEAAVLAKLLAGDHPLLKHLRTQLDSATAAGRQMTGVGFFLDIGYAGEPAPVRLPGFRIHDVMANAGTEPVAAFNVLVEGGRLTQLEGVAFGDRWPDDLGTDELSYIHGDERGPTVRELSEAYAGD